MKQKNHTNKLQAKLHEVWRRHQTLQAVAGVLALFKWSILLLAGCVLVDWLTDLPAILRGVLMFAVILFALFKAWRMGWAKLQSFDPAHNALKIEAHFGNLKSLLVSAVQFGAEADQTKGSENLREVTRKEAEIAISELPTRETIRFNILRRPAIVALLMLALISVLAVTNKPFLAAAFGRFFTPWSQAAYPTRTQLTLGAGDITVKEGAPVSINAKIAGIIPANAVIALRTDNGKPRDHAIEVHADACEYKINSAFRSFEYRMTAGDDTSPWHRVTVIASPKITKVLTTVQYPTYTRKDNESSEALTLTAPEGSIVAWKLELDRAVAKASFDCEGDQPIPMAISQDGRTVSGTYTVKSSRVYHFSWMEKSQGYAFESPNHFLQVAPDNAPRVELVSPSEDLYAIIGRQIDLSFIARDDFGISEASIVYHLNNHPEKMVRIDDKAIESGTVYQSDWDYRQHLKNIKIGDILRFGVAVKDHFPSKDGPNESRSRMRRVTFLTEADYVQQVENRKLRLLGKLRSIYRQGRASYAVVSNLNPSSESFQQTCMLEGVRQDLLTERMKVVVDRIKYLIDDIKANKIEAAVQTEDLQVLSHQLQQISSKHINRASTELRELAQTSDLDSADVSSASLSINTASREIASLVLKLGVKYASEVLARELQTAIHIQTDLHSKSLDLIAKPESYSAEMMSEKQNHLSLYLDRLFNELGENPDYSNSAMAALRLSRMIKDIRSTKLEEEMGKVSALFKERKFDASIAPQEEILNTLKTTVYRLKARAEMDALLKARNSIQAVLLDTQRSPAGRYAMLRTVILPKIPMPRQSMVDPNLPSEIKPQQVFKSLLADIQVNEPSRQKNAHAGMQQMINIINQRITEMSQFGELFSLMMNIEGRSLKLKASLAQQSALLEQTEDALDDEKSVVNLADQQEQLTHQIKSLYHQIEASLGNKKFTGFASALVDPLKNASVATAESAELMKENEGEDALEKQEEAVSSLKAAVGIMGGESKTLEQLINIVQLEKSISLTSRYFADIGAEQEDIVAAGKGASAEQLAQLALVQKNLSRCLPDVMASLAGPIDNKDMASLLEFAQSSFGSATTMLEAGKQSDAAASQTEAADLLQETGDDIIVIAARNTYVAAMMDFLYRKSAAAMNIFAAQKQLNFDAQYNKDIKPDVILKRQETLLLQARQFGDDLFRVTKQGHFHSTARYMEKAVKSLKAGKHELAMQDMNRAEGAINVERSEFSAVMVKLVKVPEILPANLNAELKLLLDILDLSITQRDLTRALWLADDDPNHSLVQSQIDLLKKLNQLMQSSDNHQVLVAAHDHLSKVPALLKKSSQQPVKQEAYREQREAEGFLRGFILEYAYTYVWLGRGNGKKKSPYSEPFREDTIAENKQLDKFDIFQKMAVQGDLPEDQKSEWEVLGRRERAALNENFARELPLEYRVLLKDYYESLAK
jgi:hypothetical protein